MREEVAKTLLQNLIARGLVVERARLFVVDGGKGLRKAIRGIFGAWALIQRCQVHKMRNVLEHLPERRKAWVRAAIRRAWSANTVARAKEQLRTLAAQLRADHPGASASIEEGLDGTIRRVTRNVKRWRDGSMVLRWVVTALMEAEKKFQGVETLDKKVSVA